MTITRGNLEAEFAYIKAHIEAKFYPPTDEEIALHFGMKKTTVHYHRYIMRARGWIAWRKNYPRTMRITR